MDVTLVEYLTGRPIRVANAMAIEVDEAFMPFSVFAVLFAFVDCLLASCTTLYFNQITWDGF